MSILNDSSDFNLLSPRSKSREQVRIGRSIRREDATTTSSSSSSSRQTNTTKSPVFHRMPVMMEGNEDVDTPIKDSPRKVELLPPLWNASNNNTPEKKSAGSDEEYMTTKKSSPFQLDNVPESASAKVAMRMPSPPPMSDEESFGENDNFLSPPPPPLHEANGMNEEDEGKEPGSPWTPQFPTDSMNSDETKDSQISPHDYRSLEKYRSRSFNTTEQVEKGVPLMSQRGSLGRVRSFEPPEIKQTVETVEMGSPHMSQRGSLGRIRSFDAPKPVSTPAASRPAKLPPPPPPPKNDNLSFDDLAAISRFSSDFSKKSMEAAAPRNVDRLYSTSDDDLSRSTPDVETGGHRPSKGPIPIAYRVPRQKKGKDTSQPGQTESEEKDPTKFEELPFWLTVLFLTVLGMQNCGGYTRTHGPTKATRIHSDNVLSMGGL
eukprot:scaffold276_cov132-Cylindrotheca_fusiformis.AAC.7